MRAHFVRGYTGFVAAYEEGFYDEEQYEGFKEFVKTWPKYKKMMEDMGITAQDTPDLDETIFIRTEKKP